MQPGLHPSAPCRSPSSHASPSSPPATIPSPQVAEHTEGYLDILADLSRQFPQPWAVYEVSGEYAGIELLARDGLANRVGAHREAWTAFVRAGASMIISYGARYAREWLAE